MESLSIESPVMFMNYNDFKKIDDILATYKISAKKKDYET